MLGHGLARLASGRNLLECRNVVLRPNRLMTRSLDATPIARGFVLCGCRFSGLRLRLPSPQPQHAQSAPRTQIGLRGCVVQLSFKAEHFDARGPLRIHARRGCKARRRCAPRCRRQLLVLRHPLSHARRSCRHILAVLCLLDRPTLDRRRNRVFQIDLSHLALLRAR